MIIRALLFFSTARPGLFVAHVPVLLNGNRDVPYRTLTLKGELLSPNIKFDPECLRLTPVPLGTQVSVDFNIIATGYRRYVKTINLFFLPYLCNAFEDLWWSIPRYSLTYTSIKQDSLLYKVVVRAHTSHSSG